MKFVAAILMGTLLFSTAIADDDPMIDDRDRPDFNKDEDKKEEDKKDDEDKPKPEDHPLYDDKEKEKWMFGRPGDAHYKDQFKLSDEELAMLEKEWAWDGNLAYTKGLIQGWVRGFYKKYGYELPAKCFDRTAIL